MKIAFLVGEFPTLSETFVLNQITGLIDQGHEVDIYAVPPQKPGKVHPDVWKYELYKKTFYYEKIPSNYLIRFFRSIQLLATWGIRYPRKILQAFNFRRFGRYARSLRLVHEVVPFLKNSLPRYDVIHCHFGPNGVKAMHLRDLGVIQGKLSTVFHGLDVSGYLAQEGNLAYDQLLQQGDLFLPISERWKTRLLELGAPPQKVSVHHMGIDCQEFLFQPRQWPPEETLQITTVCRLVEKKGVEYGIRAVAALKPVFSHVQYTIVGDGPLKSSLEHLVKELQAEDTIQLLGWQNQQGVIEILRQTHLFLAPSVTASNGDQEGIPVALMEAMAMGIPVVSTYHSGIPELIEHQVSGFLVAEKDVDALVQVLLESVRNSERLEPICNAARKKIETDFDIHNLNERLIKTLHKLATSKSTRKTLVGTVSEAISEAPHHV